MEYEQNLKALSIAVILIRAKSKRLVDLLPHASEVLRVLQTIHAGQLAKVG
jgi:hypothetical protein